MVAWRSKSPARQLHVSPHRFALLMALGIFLVTFSISSYFAKSTLNQNRNDYYTQLNQRAVAVRQHIDTSLMRYSQLLRSTSALFTVKGELSRDDWAAFYSTAKVEQDFPSLVGLGYVTVLPADAGGEFQQRVIDSGLSGYTVHPAAVGDRIAPITYIMPNTTLNASALGFDMYTSTIRKAAMDQARDTDMSVMSAPMRLMQDSSDADAPLGIAMYLPVYTTPQAPSTVEERRANLRGFVYIVLRPSDMVSHYVSSQPDTFKKTSVEVTDADDSSRVLFKSEVQGVSDAAIMSSVDESVDSRTWHISVRGNDSYTNTLSPVVLFILGGIVSLLLSGFTYWLLSSRIRRITKVYEGEVQRTKDELLALASHQLRTPASGVKQYIGMLTSGMMGELTSDQQMIAEKAYETNERQIQIINELLYVSKADAGQLVIEPKQFDVTRLTQKVVDGFSDQAAEKNISVLFTTKKPHLIVADDRYVSMIIENLVSNAIKYSYPSSTVRVGMTARRNTILLSVKDRGVGLDSIDAEHIFGKFNRVDNPLSHSEGGSGLGLFLARQLARAHGGDIAVESKLDKGSTFTLSLPKELTINETIVHLNPVRKEQI